MNEIVEVVHGLFCFDVQGARTFMTSNFLSDDTTSCIIKGQLIFDNENNHNDYMNK